MQDTQQLQSAISTYPLPLAQALRRAVNAKSPQEQHNGAYYFFESALKLAASAQLGVYFSLGCPHGPLNQLIENLTRPSVGHWLALLRETSSYLASRQDNALLPLHGTHERLTAKKPMPAAKAFLEFAAKASEKHEARQSFRVLDLFDAVVSYRNQELGHGAMRERAFYAEASPLLLEAALEAVNTLRPVGDLQFVVARDVVDPRTQKASRRFDVLRGDGLHLPLDAAQPRDAEIAAGRLLLAGGATRVSLHPLLVYEIDKLDRDRVGFLNHVAASGRGDTQKLKRVEYLDYDSGERLEGHDALGELAGLLSKVRGQAVSIDAVAALSQGGAEVNAGEAPSDKGQFIGDFELLEELGRGGMGVVYKARQNSLRRIVALKVLPPGVAGDPVSVARFKREIAALGRCDHPNVVKVLTAGQDGERHFYAMEYVEGSDLAQVCGVLSHWKTGSLKEGHILKAITDSRAQRTPAANTGQASLPDVPKAAEIVPEISEGRDYFTRLAEIIGDAASGVQHLHEHGIIHRDLKPANVMLTGDGRRAVIMDLGLAQLQDRSLSLTASSVKILGTLRYMPPEQLQHQMLEVTPKADIYSLGATLYELAALAPMFDGDTEARLMQQVLQEEPKSPRSHNAAMPRDLETIITVATAKAPADRYATAGVLAADLRAFARGEPISARAPTTFHYLKLFYRKNTRLVQGLAAALALLLALTAWFVVSLDESRAKAETAAETARQKEAEARSEAERANKAEQDAKDKARAAEEARDEANRQRGRAEFQTREAEAALREAARNLQQVHMEKGKAAAERGEAALALNHFAQAARMAEELADQALFGGAWEQFCKAEPRLPLELWSTATTGFTLAQENISFSADGAVMAGHCAQAVSCIETATGRVLCQFEVPSTPEFLALSGDATRLVLGNYNSAQLWDARSGKRVCELAGFSDGSLDATFTDGGATLVALNKKGQCFTFEAASGVQRSVRDAGYAAGYGVFSRDGAHFMLLGKNKALEVFETASLKSVRKFDCGSAWPRAMALCAGGTVAAVAGDKDRILVWDVASGKLLSEREGALVPGRSLEFSSRGMLAAALSSGQIWLYENDWQQPRVLAQHVNLVRSLRFVHDDKYLVVGRLGAHARFLDVGTGANVLEAPGLRANVARVALSPDGRCVAATTYDCNIVLFDAHNGREIRKLAQIEIAPMHLCFLPDGRTLACCGLRPACVVLLDYESGEVLRQFAPLEKDEKCVDLACSPDGRCVFAATNQSRVRRYTVSGEFAPRAFKLPPVGEFSFAAAALRVTRDGERLAVADHAGVVLWLAADDGSLLGRDLVSEMSSQFIAMSDDAGRIAYAVGRESLVVRDRGGKTYPLAIGADLDALGVSFTPEGELLVINSRKQVRLLNVETAQWRTLLASSGEQPWLALSVGGARALLVYGSSGRLSLYSLEAARSVQVPLPGRKEVIDVFWLPGTSLLALGAVGAPARLVDVLTGRVVAEFGAGGRARCGFALSPDGNTLICGGAAPSVVAYDLAGGKTRDVLALVEGQLCFGGDFSPDGKTLCLAVASEKEGVSSMLVFVDVATGASLREVKFEKGMPLFVRYIDNGKRLVVARLDAKPAVLDAASGTALLEFGLTGEQSLAYDLSHGHTLLLAPGEDSSLKLFDVATGGELGTLAGHSRRVVRCAFSPDDKLAASLSDDETVRVWDLASRRELAQAPCSRSADIAGLCFSPDGRFVVFMNKQGDLQAWEFSPAAQLPDAKGMDAKSIAALAHVRSGARLAGFELEPTPAAGPPVTWRTGDGRGFAPPGPGVPQAESLNAASALWLESTRAALVSWLVAQPLDSWRRQFRAWRHVMQNGKHVGIEPAVPWDASHVVEYSDWWSSNKYGPQASAYEALASAEEAQDWPTARARAAKLYAEKHEPWLAFRYGRALYRAGVYSEGWGILSDYLYSEPNCLSAMAWAAVCISKGGYPDGGNALEQLDKAIAAGIRAADVYLARAVFRAHAGKWDDASADCAEAEKLQPGNPELFEVRARILLGKAQPAEAEAQCNLALDASPASGRLLSLRAEIREKRENFAGAIEDLSAAIGALRASVDFDDKQLFAYCHLRRAALLFKARELEKSLADLNQFLALARGGSWDVEALTLRGRIFYEQCEFAKAFKDFTAAADDDESLRELAIWRARTAEKMGEFVFAWDLWETLTDSGASADEWVEAACAACLLADAVQANKLSFACFPADEREEQAEHYANLSEAQRKQEVREITDAAHECLDHAAAAGFAGVETLENDARLGRMRKDARFAEILRRVRANKK